MRTIREILRLKWSLSRSHRETARSLGISAGAVASVVARAGQLGLTWPDVEPLSEDELDRRLYGPRLAARATREESDPVWIHTELRRAGVTLELLHLEYLAVVVPDQLGTGVTDPCRYEPGLQRTYNEWAHHYDTVVIPARPRAPRDKAKVEAGVLVAERWILARLRHEVFHSLAALNARIRELLTALNERPMRGYGGQSRRDLFERCDRPALRALPPTRYEHADWRTATVNIDYHVEVEKHLYSVPHQLIHEKVDIRVTATLVDILLRGVRVYLHRRSFEIGKYTTIPEHMPKSHRAHAEWSPSRLIHWGGTIGPQTAALIAAILESRRHPEQGYRSCLGLLRLSKHYPAERLEAACGRALLAGARSYRHVANILKHGLDRTTGPAEPTAQTLPLHENVRGADFYATVKGLAE